MAAVTREPLPLLDVIEHSLDLRPRTRELYIECVKSFLAFVGSDPRSLGSPRYTAADVERWLIELRKEREPQTVNVYRKAIRYASRRWVKYAGADERRDDFAAQVDKIKVTKKAPKAPMSYEEAKKLLAACDGAELVDIRDRALIVTALRTGLRRGGLEALTFEGIAPPRITTINKGGDTLTFEADPETLDALQRWMGHVRAAGIATGQIFRDIDDDDKIGPPMTPFKIWYAFKRRARKAKIRAVYPHLARHTLVTWLREQGLSSATVGRLTGQTERTIENIYTHVQTHGPVANALPSLLPPKADAEDL